MNKDQVKSVLRYLAQASAKKQIKWEITADDEFRAVFPKSAVLVGYNERGIYTSISNSSVYGPYVDFYNGNGVKILRVDMESVKQFELSATILGALYQQAKNQVFQYDETFNDILGQIGGAAEKKSDESHG